MLNETLRSIGLTEYETKIYLALIEIGESTSGDIMNKANINSGRIYQILDSLKNKGIISEIVKDKVRYFSPTDPKRILDYLNEKEELIQQQKTDIAKVIPDILAKINYTKTDPKIEIFTGFEGLKSAFLKEMDRYEPGVEITILGVKKTNLYTKKVFDYFKYKIYPERLRKNVRVRKINDIEFKTEGETPEEGVEIKYLPNPSTLNINVIKELTLITIIAEEQPIIITIESEEVARGFKNQFETLWSVARE